MNNVMEKAYLKRKPHEGSRPNRLSFDAVSASSSMTSEFYGLDDGARGKDLNQVYETNGVRLIPAEIVFHNALGGQSYTTAITICNISSQIIFLSISQPYSSAFQIKDDGTTIKLAPGLSITRKIMFTCGEAKQFFSAAPIRIGSKLILLPIKVFPGQTRVVIEPTFVNFGKIDLGSAFMTRTVQLQNKGSIAAKFIIDQSKNELDIIILPRAGSIKPFGHVDVKIHLAGLCAGVQEVEFWVKTTPPSRFVVHVTVVIPHLRAVHPFATEEFTLLDIKPCFIGTTRYETFLVENSSANKSSVIVLAELDGLVITPQIAARSEASFRCLSLQPLDGTLGPFECRIFTLWFSPVATKPDQGWRRLTDTGENVQYLCFFRVQRVTLTNAIESANRSTQQFVAKKCELIHEDGEREFEGGERELTVGGISHQFGTLDEQENDNILRVCAYAIAVKPRLTFVPDHLVFEKIQVGQSYKKVLQIHNPCELPLGFSYFKQAHISVNPAKVVSIEPKKSVEVQVILHPKSLQFEHNRLIFEMLSYQNMISETNLIAIGKVCIKLTINILATTEPALPQFLPGITPRMHPEGEEVGLHTEMVLFSSIPIVELPAAVVWPQWTGCRPWMTSDARIAFPNDRRRSLRVTANDGNVRTIFTGESRYNPPPDLTNVYTSKEKCNRSKEVAYYKNFVAKAASKVTRFLKAMDPDEPRPIEYEVSDERLYTLLNMMPPTKLLDYKPQTRKNAKFHDSLCPLTPLELFNIKVNPHVIDFGKVPPRTRCVTTVAVDNMNDFPIEVRLKSYKETLKVPREPMVVPAQATATEQISICVDQIGKHFTNMTYIINTYHSYDIRVCADVETRYLIIEPGDLSFRDKNNLFVKHFLPVKLINPLGSDSKFRWRVPSSSPFGVAPISGTVPARSTLICSVYFDLKNGNILGAVLILLVEDGLSTHYPVNFIPSEGFPLSLFSPKISCPNTPLGIEFVKKIILYNYGRRLTFFSIDTSDLPKGIKLLPLAGMIKPRSCAVLSVHFLFTEIRTFSFKVPIVSANFKRISLTCNGYTTYPKVAFKPPAFRFRKTPAHSHACGKFDLINESSSDAQISFVMGEFPQFQVSRSSDIVENGAIVSDGSFVTLYAKETMPLYLHFEPHNLHAYKFLLPMVINNFIGPPILGDLQSLASKTYVTHSAHEGRVVHKISAMITPDKLSALSVDVVVQQGYIQCSSLLFSFFRTNVKEKGGQPLVVQNIMPSSSLTLRFCIPDVDKEIFSIHNKGIVLDANEIVILDTAESIELTVFFHPPGAGTFSAGVPVYVEEFSTLKPYTMLKIRGIFYRSTLACADSHVNFLPVDVSAEIDRIIYIVANHQPEETKLKVELRGTDSEDLNEVFSFIFPNGDLIPYGFDNFRVPLKIKFKSESITSVVGFLKVHDGYDGECTITITAVADKSLLTTYAFQFLTDILRQPVHSKLKSDVSASTTNAKVIEEMEEFPLFPKSSSDSPFAKFMCRTKESMEDWLYEQGFQGTYRMTIGEEFFLSECFQSAIHSKNKNAHFDDVKGIVDLISKLTGREFSTQYPLPPSIPVTNEKRIEYALIVYKTVLTFLCRQGGHLVHVSPLYLLNYDDYELYHNKLKPLQLQQLSGFFEISQLSVVMTKQTYERLTVQCWLDVFLQLYKVLVFYPTIYEPLRCFSTVEARFSSSSMDKSTSSSPKSRTKLRPRSQRQVSPTYIAAHEKSEEDLLGWINDVFSQNKPHCVPPKKVTNFHRDLADGIVLSVVTAHYCPYLFPEFWSQLYLNPKNASEAQQNIAILALAWHRIRIGLTVTAEEVMTAHPVKFLMICCLLYHILPSYLPLEAITFEGCLADSIVKKIQIFNPSNHAIGFAIRKFDSNNNFSVVEPKKQIIIKPESSVKVTINFYAKSLFKVTGTLVLCGSHVPGGFANNVVFRLRGIPVRLQHRFALNVHCPLYKVSKVTTNINSPFMSEGKYTLSLTEAEPRPGVVKMKPWAAIRHRKVIRSVYLYDESMFVPPIMDLPTPLTMIIAAIQLKPKDYWLVFSNQKLGDFIAKITVTPSVTAPQHFIYPTYPTRHCVSVSEKGLCTHSDCPRLVHVAIPSKNYKLWAAVQAMISHTLNDVEKAFWNDYLETGLGLKLLAWIARQYYMSYTELNFLFQTKVTYSVECNSPFVTCPATLTIDDVHSKNTVDLPMHVCQGVKGALVVNLKLKSDNERELRFYQLFFYRKPA